MRLVFLGKILDAEQARFVLKWIGGMLIALTVVAISIGILVFHQIWLLGLFIFGLPGLGLYKGEVSRSGIRTIIIAPSILFLAVVPVFIQAWTPGSRFSDNRVPASMGLFLILAVLALGLRARQAAKIIQPPPNAPWWLP
jgi:hypothetical protein